MSEFDTTAEKIRGILREHGRLSTDVQALDNDSDLYQAGMTSTANLSIMFALEQEFDIEFPDHMLERTLFESIASIRSAVLQLTSRGN